MNPMALAPLAEAQYVSKKSPTDSKSEFLSF